MFFLSPGTSSRLHLGEDSRTIGRHCFVCKASRRWRSESGPPVALLCRYQMWYQLAHSFSRWALCGLLHQDGPKIPGAHGLAHRETVGCPCYCTLCTPPRAGSDHHDHPDQCCPLCVLCCLLQAHPGYQNLQGGWAEEGEARSLVLGRREGVREARRLDEVGEVEQSCSYISQPTGGDR